MDTEVLPSQHLIATLPNDNILIQQPHANYLLLAQLFGAGNGVPVIDQN
jgi:hypothetical protein